MAKKCIKSLFTSKVVVLLIKPIAFLKFSLLSLSLLLKFPIDVIQKFCCHDVKVMSHFSSLRSLNGVSGYSHSFIFLNSFYWIKLLTRWPCWLTKQHISFGLIQNRISENTWITMHQRNWSWIQSALGKDPDTLSSSGQRRWHDIMQVILDNWSLTRSPPRNAPRICMKKILDPCGEKHVCSSQPTCFRDIRYKIIHCIADNVIISNTVHVTCNIP